MYTNRVLKVTTTYRNVGMIVTVKCSLFTACTSCTRVYSVQFGMAAEDEVCFDTFNCYCTTPFR